MARIPVSRGTLTDFLSTTPGASFSIGLYSVVLIGPLPSIGAPKAFTTLPSISSPTEIPAFLPVLTTLEPSVRPLSEPKRTTPIVFISRFCTIPLTPFSNSTISPYIAWFIP